MDDTAAQGVEDHESEKAPLLAEQEQDELAVRRDEMVAERPRHGEFQIYRFFLQAVPKWMIILFTITIAIVAFLERSEGKEQCRNVSYLDKSVSLTTF